MGSVEREGGGHISTPKKVDAPQEEEDKNEEEKN